MIARINGTLLSKTPSAIIVDVHGIGYELFIPLSSYYPLCNTGETVSLFTHTHVREDALLLFGFLTEAEKSIFELLISISKVGPKLALGILSGISVQELFSAVAKGNVAALQSIPGVGRKTAERLALELKDKMKKMALAHTVDFSKEQHEGEESITDDASSALVNLGYKKDDAERIVKKIAGERGAEMTVEELIRNSLKDLSNG